MQIDDVSKSEAAGSSMCFSAAVSLLALFPRDLMRSSSILGWKYRLELKKRKKCTSFPLLLLLHESRNSEILHLQHFFCQVIRRTTKMSQF